MESAAALRAGESRESDKRGTQTATARTKQALHRRDSTLNSAELFADRIEVQIQHGDATYRLRKTALGKLILTK